jgi:hypothetical protein
LGAASVYRNLNLATAIPEVNEDNAAHVPAPVYPACQGDSLPDVLDSQLPTFMRF